MKENNSQISSIVNQNIYNTGDGIVVNTGDHSIVKAKIDVKKGDKSELVEKLKRGGVTDDDINILLEVIDSEKPNIKMNTFGVRVNSWMKDMIGKAVDGTWTIGAGAAGTLLAEAIKKYYGM